MIPKLFHHVWIGGTPLPPIFSEFRDAFQVMHPDWTFMFWDDQAVRELSCSSLLPTCRSVSSQVNAIRLEILLRHGGVYVDTDVEPLKPFDPLLEGTSAFAAKETGKVICNAVVGAERNHPWIRWQFQRLYKYVQLDPPWGPMLMSRAHRSLARRINTDITLFPTQYFYPFLWNDLKLRGSNDFPNSYCVHHWAISWNPKISWKELRRKEEPPAKKFLDLSGEGFTLGEEFSNVLSIPFGVVKHLKNDTLDWIAVSRQFDPAEIERILKPDGRLYCKNTLVDFYCNRLDATPRPLEDGPGFTLLETSQ